MFNQNQNQIKNKIKSKSKFYLIYRSFQIEGTKRLSMQRYQSYTINYFF